MMRILRWLVYEHQLTGDYLQTSQGQPWSLDPSKNVDGLPWTMDHGSNASRSPWGNEVFLGGQVDSSGKLGGPIQINGAVSTLTPQCCQGWKCRLTGDQEAEESKEKTKVKMFEVSSVHRLILALKIRRRSHCDPTIGPTATLQKLPINNIACCACRRTLFLWRLFCLPFVSVCL